MSTNNIPVGSQAKLLPSPLGTNVPIYKMADRYGLTYSPVNQLAGRPFPSGCRWDIHGSGHHHHVGW